MKKYVFLILTMFFATGCFLKSEDNKQQNEAKNTPVITPEPPVQVEPTPAPMAVASGWSEVTIIANSAKTRIGTGGHFNTTRNACGHEAYGPIEVQDWNTMTNSLNVALQKEPLHEEYCVSIPETTPYMDGTVEAKSTAAATQIIYQLRGDQICSTVSDSKISNELLSAITKIIVAADKEDCPNGWGSN